MNETSTHVRHLFLCQECENRFESVKHAMECFGYSLLPAPPFGWFLSTLQCGGCGTTERGLRWRHELRALTLEQTAKAKEPVFEPTEYDKQIAYAYGVKL